MTAELSPDFMVRKRYRVAVDQTLPVTIQRFANGQQRASGELADISQSGARIVLETPLQFGEKVVLHLESQPGEPGISVGCQVQWIRGRGSEGELTVACRFENLLDESIIDGFIEQGLLERRQSDRHTIPLPASLKIEGVGDEEVEVDLLDIGTGGFCLRSPIPGAIGLRVRMTVDVVDGMVEGRIMWQTDDDGEYVIGCQWENRKGVAFARQMTQATVLQPETPRSRITDHLVGAIVVAVIAFTLGVLTALASASGSGDYPTNGNDLSVIR